MRINLIRFAAVAAFCCLPFQLQAVPFTLTIDGVDPAGPSTLPFGGTPTPLPGVFVGLGTCSTPGAPTPCIGTGVDLNTLSTPQQVADKNAEILNNTGVDPAFTNAVIFGFGFEMDQVIFHQL